MSNNTLNLALRFLLELAGLAAFAIYGWVCHTGAMQWILAIGLPLIAAAAWGIFRSPRDPNPVVIAVPGSVRLLLEAAFFLSAALALYFAGYSNASRILAFVTALHYAFSMDRINMLLKK